MKINSMHRRVWLSTLALTLTVGTTGSTWAQAPNFPSKPIRLVVPFPPGGGTDTIARLLGEKLSQSLKQPVVIENKAGAAGIIGTDMVAKATPDGHTLVLSLSNSLLTNQFLYEKLPYSPERDLVRIYQVGYGPLVLLVNSNVPAKSAMELVNYVKANKGKLSYGSYGNGSYPHLAGSYMSQSLNADMSHIPYKGEAPMMQELMSGQIQMAYVGGLQAKSYLDSGKIRAIGITGERRMSVLPDVPTLAEQGLKDDVYRITGWVGVAAAAATPKPVVDRIAAELRAACQLPDVRNKLSAIGIEIKDSSPEAFEVSYRQEFPVWKRLIAQSGVKLD